MQIEAHSSFVAAPEKAPDTIDMFNAETIGGVWLI